MRKLLAIMICFLSLFSCVGRQNGILVNGTQRKDTRKANATNTGITPETRDAGTVTLRSMAIESYRCFMNGDMPTAGGLYIYDVLYEPEHETDGYALFDMNHDSVPELHLKFRTGYMLMSYYDGSLVIWHDSNYSYPLNNGFVKYEHVILQGVQFRFTAFDLDGRSITQSFDKYWSIGNGCYDAFAINGEECPEEHWNNEIAYLMSLTDSDIDWHKYAADMNDFVGLE